jgi:hypothetical protein
VIPVRLRTLVALLGATAAILALDGMGSGVLAPPPLSVAGASEWLAQRDGVVAAFALLRLAALAAGWYLLLIVTASAIARSLAWRPAEDALARLTLPSLRVWLSGAGVTSAAFLGLIGPPDTAVLHPLPDPATTTIVPAQNESATASIRPLPNTPDAVETPAPSDVVTPSDDSWVVESGDSFWSIASSHLADIRGRAVADGEVMPYWREVVEHNRAILANPADPDLLFPGQVVELPPVLAG